MTILSYLPIDAVADQLPHRRLSRGLGLPPLSLAQVDEGLQEPALGKLDAPVNLGQLQTMTEIKFQVFTVHQVIFARIEGGRELLGLVLGAPPKLPQALLAVRTQLVPGDLDVLGRHGKRVVTEV